MPWMPPALAKFFTYWSLTFAVFLFYLFAFIVAGMDIWESLMETVRKRRQTLRPAPAYDPNPLAGRTIAATLGGGPGQRPDAKRGWVLDRARAAAQALGLDRLQIVVLEDSKEHPLVHFTDGRQLRSYRVDKTWVAEGRAGNADRERQIIDLLQRYLASDFLGRHDVRPRRTTELARGKEA
ncbi:MAG TPA: hypothetical protein VNN19_03125 [bacterium]|nr:hypothetical protein [bacterium]